MVVIPILGLLAVIVTQSIRGVMDDVLSGIGLQNNQTYYIKRVIGLPGDHVACCTDGKVTVNGVPLSEGSYLYPGNPPSFNKFNEVVPAGHLWVMGDHRSDSDDFALSPGLSGRRCDTREPGRGPRVPHHLAAVADPRSAHPVDLPAGRAERRGGRPGGRGGRRRRCHRSPPAPAAPTPPR